MSDLVELLKPVFSAERIYTFESLPSDHRLPSILKKLYPTDPTSKPSLLWGVDFFGLDQSTYFKKLPPEIQAGVLQNLTDHNLTTAYYVEVSGLFLCSKLIALSDTLEERVLYSRLVSDEARHLSWVTPFMAFEVSEASPKHKLLDLIGQLIQDCGKHSMTFLAQVILEGFGIPYYQEMREHCLNDGFKDVLRKILVDEAYHHGSGLVIFDEKKLGSTDEQTLVGMAAKMIQILRVGAAARLGEAIESVTGVKLTESERHGIISESGAMDAVHERSEKIKKIVGASASEKLMKGISSAGVFSPLL